MLECSQRSRRRSQGSLSVSASIDTGKNTLKMHFGAKAEQIHGLKALCVALFY
jgi:hypothetical protein